MWETREMELFFTYHFHECWIYADQRDPNNPPFPVDTERFNWYVVSVTDYWAGNHPHFKVMLESDAIGNESKLLRGEIMTITDIMAARLRTKSLRPHIVAPILVLSLMGPRYARILGADFDGKILNIRAYKLYDFTKKNRDAAQLLTRYWFSGAGGQTEMELS
ncbi:hypothetical protein ASPACDRAFT_60025 [Aspergillus aculeatus ATCC 16872]|uniref:Uncharacterized protein n=1 Tax=Aspergillus aculeatus (strain ATCC 16872 / CBS 172.66 / WB 5094) TaxID=690307 RepID=A0A1L9WVK6_ASPA1|nr:uncharacterized protein ASPACDRAFT_60025 [Aspergillus aculeatus ATCC 16872]OJK00174.1 hypothetical protein ASPACDRAFT_60025 [Aspergillus aculeatus ATCC 16872]